MEAALAALPRSDRPDARRRGDVQREAVVRRAAAARLHHRRTAARSTSTCAAWSSRGPSGGTATRCRARSRSGSTTSSSVISKMGFAGLLPRRRRPRRMGEGQGDPRRPRTRLGRRHDHVLLPRHHDARPDHATAWSSSASSTRNAARCPTSTSTSTSATAARSSRYLRQKYGEDRVAQIVTFATIKAKSGIRDSARVLGYPYGMGDRLAKMFPRPMLGKDPSLKDCFEKSKDSKWTYAYNEAAELRKAYEEETDARRVLDAALQARGSAPPDRRARGGRRRRTRAARELHRAAAHRPGRRRHAVRDARHREARPPQGGHPRPRQPHRHRAHARAAAQRRDHVRHRQRPARRPEGVRAAAARRRRRRVPARVGRHAPAAEVAASGPLRGHRRADRALPSGPDAGDRQVHRRQARPRRRALPARAARGRPRRHLRRDRLPGAGAAAAAARRRVHGRRSRRRPQGGRQEGRVDHEGRGAEVPLGRGRAGARRRSRRATSGS